MPAGALIAGPLGTAIGAGPARSTPAAAVIVIALRAGP